MPKMSLGALVLGAGVLASGLIGCGSRIVPPTLSVVDRAPDGKVEFLEDRTDPDEGDPEHRAYLRATGETGDGVPILAMDTTKPFADSGGVYSNEWTGRRELSIWSDDLKTGTSRVRLTNGEVVSVVVRPYDHKPTTERVVNGPNE